MNVKKTIFIVFIILILMFLYPKLTFGVSYIWSDSSGLLETVSDSETDLNLESSSAILIEQSTRFCFI